MSLLLFCWWGFVFKSRTRDSRICYVGLPVGLSKTKCERYLAIPLLPTRPRLGGVCTALFLMLLIARYETLFSYSHWLVLLALSV